MCGFAQCVGCTHSTQHSTQHSRRIGLFYIDADMKRFFGFILFTALLAMAAGCGNNGKTGNNAGSTTAAEYVAQADDSTRVVPQYAKGYKGASPAYTSFEHDIS